MNSAAGRITLRYSSGIKGAVIKKAASLELEKHIRATANIHIVPPNHIAADIICKIRSHFRLLTFINIDSLTINNKHGANQLNPCLFNLPQHFFHGKDSLLHQR
jgi:hypothetical protein